MDSLTPKHQTLDPEPWTRVARLFQSSTAAWCHSWTGFAIVSFLPSFHEKERDCVWVCSCGHRAHRGERRARREDRKMEKRVKERGHSLPFYCSTANDVNPLLPTILKQCPLVLEAFGSDYKMIQLPHTATSILQEALNKITLNLQKPSWNSACKQKKIFKNQFFFHVWSACGS